MANKMTNAMALTYVLENCELTDEVREKIEALLGSVNRKSSHKSEKELEAQKENEKLKADILSLMEVNKAYAASDIVKLLENSISVSKASALMVQLAANGDVNKTVEKRKNFYTLVE